MPLWFKAAIAIAALLGAGLLVWALRGDRARGRRRCPKCWYDMAATLSLMCPECGRTARSEAALLRTRRRWGWAALGFALLLAAGVAVPTRALAVKGWEAVPTPVLIAISPWMSLDATRPDGSTNGFATPFARAVQAPLPPWQQRFLGRRLVARLKDADAKQRGLAATYMLLSMIQGGNEVLDEYAPALVNAVDDADSDAAYAAVCALGQMRLRDRGLIPIWERLLRDSPHEDVRSSAAAVLSHLAQRGDRQMLSDFSRALLDPSDQVASQAVYGLGFMRDPEALPALILAACSGRPGTESAACHGLELLEESAAPAVPALLGLIHRHSSAGGWAIIALGRIGPAAKDAVPDLISRLRAPGASQRAREESAIALGRIGDARPGVIAALTASLSDTPPVRAGCVEALYRLGWTAAGTDRALIETFLEDKSGAMRIWARMLLARADGTLDAEVDRLIPLLNGQDWWVSTAAILALDSLGPRAERALPALRALCPPPSRKGDDSDTQLKRQAAEPAVRHITGER